MDFFDRQAAAQKKTGLLIFYFALAIVCLIALIVVAVSQIASVPWNDPQLLAYVTLGTIAVVAIGSLTKIAELAQGGRVVAAMLGGEPVTPNTSDPQEKKLLNVVEEMSLASGVPVPEVYVLNDNTINAFAAGHGPGDTAIGVTRGCIDKLSRDELQGVIAHEFSHILHGDMKLNVRLIGLLNGILCVALIGAFVMRIFAYIRVDDGGSSNDGDRKNGMALTVAVFLIGLAVYIIGYIGVFFGNLIKAAVSRQREFLADASAVQYTRNPDGIAGALWKIGKFESRLSSPRAEEASHLYFGDGLAARTFSFFDTHPPLDDRIRAIAPGFEPPAELDRPPAPSMQRPPVSSQPPPLPTQPASTAETLQRTLAGAAALLASVPDFALSNVRDLHGAIAFVYAMLLDEREDYREAQLASIGVDDAMRREVMGLYNRRSEIPLPQRLPLIDLVVPTLRQLSPDQYATFRANVQKLIAADQAVHLFEFALQKTLLRHLDLYFTRQTGAAVKYRTIIPLLPSVQTLLSALAYIDHPDPTERDAAFQTGVQQLMINAASYPMTRVDGCDLNRIDAALDETALAAPQVKRTILAACREVVKHDGVVDTQQYELLRAIADSLDCPMPPLPPVTE